MFFAHDDESIGPGAFVGLIFYFGNLFAYQHLSKLQQAFGYLIPEALLAREKVAPAGRDRIFTPVLTFWAFRRRVFSGRAARTSTMPEF